MRTLPNQQITRNFDLYEMIESQLPAEAVNLNWQNISDFNLSNARIILQAVQLRRNMINEHFKSDTGQPEIGLMITSGYRCILWERLRGRSGESQHVHSLAVDVQPINCSRQQAIEILQWLYQQDQKSYIGGLAIAHPKGNGIGFIHYDARGFKARWTY